MKKPTPAVKIADRTLDLFEVFARLKKPASLSELAEELGIPVSSCFGLIHTIEARGYLHALRPRGAYYPTNRMLNIARTISRHNPLGETLGHLLAALRDETGETVVLGHRRGTEVVYLDVYEPPNSIRYTAEVGETRALHANSIGKALLAQMSRADRDLLLQGMPLTRMTDATLTDITAIEADLAEGESRGWFQNIAESSLDVSAVAWGVRLGGEPYGVSVVGPRERMLPVLEQTARALRETIAKITD